MQTNTPEIAELHRCYCELYGTNSREFPLTMSRIWAWDAWLGQGHTKEAVQHHADMGTYTAEIPVWLSKACSMGTIYCRGNDTFIKTMEGEMLVSDGDWIIRGVKGEIYPCKPDIFAQTYEVAE